MSINVSIKNVPDDIMEKLRKRARRHHRSLQGELIVILEEAAGLPLITLGEAETRLNSLRFETREDSTRWIRELRDER